ncbi:MAG: HAMP domain-containing sensor histidine kinase [Coriobacteriia bacterium]
MSTSRTARGGKRRLRSSLSVRFITIMVLAEILFAVALALIVGMVSVRLVAIQRIKALEDVSGVIAASLMPLIADQDAASIETQLGSVMSLSHANEILHIHIEDSTGKVIAEAGTHVTGTTPSESSMWQALIGPQQIVHPVEIDGMRVATVTVTFASVGFGSAITTPLLAAGLVVLAVALISAPWSAWLMVRHIAEPIKDLRDAAASVARGERHLNLSSDRTDEIGQLAATLDWMAVELADKEQRLLASLDSLQIAYDKESRMKEELEHLMRAKSDFVAVASHELRSPLAVVSLYAEMLEDGVYGELDAETLQAVASMVSATSRLSSIVSDLMDAALLERGLMPLTVGDVDLTALAHKSARDATLLASSRGIRVEPTEFTNRVWVRGDTLRLRQVMDNLISNAVKYSYDNGLVRVDTSTEGDQAFVRVIDEGRGMPASGRESIFELFGRMEYTDDREKAGLGLGLAISARIAEAHGGRIDVERSVQGEGSVFVLVLPIAGAIADERLPRTVSME